MVEVSVVIPVYNSEMSLKELLRQLSEALRDWRHEVILVDDQSTDNSWGVIEQSCALDEALIGIRLRKNAGQDNAILCGLREAHGRFVVIMDDDLQHAPQEIQTLYAQCERRKLDVCYAQFPILRHNWWKIAGSWLNGKIAEIVIAKPRHLYLSPFKIMRQEIVQEVIKYTGAFPYVDGLILTVTHNVGQTEVPHHDRLEGKSTYSVTKSILVFMRVATGFSIWPLRFSTGTGMLCSVGAFCLAIFYLAQYMLTGHRVEGWLRVITAAEARISTCSTSL